MKTLALDDGDLVLGGGDYVTVDGTGKLSQDLSFALRERIGSDPYHPYWGSLLPYFVGQPITSDVRTRMVQGARRTLENYMAVQQAEVTAASTKGTSSRLRSSEYLQSIQSITVTDQYDTVYVAIALSTLSGNVVTVAPAVN